MLSGAEITPKGAAKRSVNKKELLCPEYGAFQRAPRGGLDRSPIGRQGGGRIVHPVKKDIIEESMTPSPPWADDFKDMHQRNAAFAGPNGIGMACLGIMNLGLGLD